MRLDEVLFDCAVRVVAVTARATVGRADQLIRVGYRVGYRVGVVRSTRRCSGSGGSYTTGSVYYGDNAALRRERIVSGHGGRLLRSVVVAGCVRSVGA